MRMDASEYQSLGTVNHEGQFEGKNNNIEWEFLLKCVPGRKVQNRLNPREDPVRQMRD